MTKDGIGHEGGNEFVFEPKRFDGVIISTRDSYGKGRPIIGRKRWNDLDFRDNWMTGDYDMMDIITADTVCKRPTPGQYGRLRFELNQAMGWPGIQHGPQATWNTRADKGFKGREQFSVAKEIAGWLGAGRGEAEKVPSKSIVKTDDVTTDRYLDLIDKDLTILGPGGGLHLPDGKDYWDALVCCGCLDKGVKPDTKHLEESPMWKKKLDAAEHNEKPWGKH
jgi:hypothetical protein